MRRPVQMLTILLMFVIVLTVSSIAVAQGTWEIIADAPVETHVNDMTVDHDGNLWLIAPATGVYRYDGAVWQLFTVEDGLKTLNVYSVAIDPAGDVWIMTMYGLNFFDGESWTFFPYYESGIGRHSSEFILGHYKSTMSVDKDVTVWCAFYSSVECFKDGAWKKYGESDGLPSNKFINCKLPNGSGNQICASVWGLAEENKVIEGAFMFDGVKWERAREITRYGTEEIPNLFSTLSYSPAGELWGTYQWTFYRLNETAWEPVYAGSHLGENILTQESAMTVDTKNNPWVNSKNGVTVYNGETLKEYTSADGYAEGLVILMTAGKDGEVWLLTEGGLSRFTPGEVFVESPEPVQFELKGNYPNPFNPSTTIVFDLPTDLTTELSIYSISGQKIRTLVSDETLSRGRHSIVWSGCDDSGNTVSSGLYLCRLKANGQTVTKRMMLMK